MTAAPAAAACAKTIPRTRQRTHARDFIESQRGLRIESTHPSCWCADGYLAGSPLNASRSRCERHLGEDIEAAGGECLRDMRVRPGGSHHQKFVVLAPSRPTRSSTSPSSAASTCATAASTDLSITGDPQRQPMAKVYGSRPPWHDVQLAVRGPAVADVETVFRERWDDPAPLTRNPFDRLADLFRREDRHAGPFRPRCLTRSHAGPTTSSRCGPIPSVGAAIRSPRTGNAASRTPTTR